MGINEIQIGPMTYTVKEVKRLHIVDDEGKHVKLHGQINWSKSLISVEKRQNDQLRACTLWHEALHGVLGQAGQEHEEALIEALGFGIVQLIQDNPDLVKFTQEAGEE